MAKRKKRPTGAVELTEAQLDRIDGGVVGAAKMETVGGAKSTSRASIADGTSNTIFFAEKSNR